MQGQIGGTYQVGSGRRYRADDATGVIENVDDRDIRDLLNSGCWTVQPPSSAAVQAKPARLKKASKGELGSHTQAVLNESPVWKNIDDDLVPPIQQRLQRAGLSAGRDAIRDAIRGVLENSQRGRRR
jgi:hypothetical protein